METEKHLAMLKGGGGGCVGITRFDAVRGHQNWHYDIFSGNATINDKFDVSKVYRMKNLFFFIKI